MYIIHSHNEYANNIFCIKLNVFSPGDKSCQICLKQGVFNFRPKCTCLVRYIKEWFFFCLFGFNVALKHLRSYHDGACL